jgi:hypothetical protein
MKIMVDMEKFNKEFDFKQAVKELEQCDISELKDVINEYEEEDPTETQQAAIEQDMKDYNLDKSEMLKALKEALESKISGYRPEHRAAAQIMDSAPYSSLARTNGRIQAGYGRTRI